MLDEAKANEKKIWIAAAEMARLFDGYAVQPHYDWNAVRLGISKMFEAIAENIK